MQAEKSHSGLLLEISDPAVMHDVAPPTHSALQSALLHLKMFVCFSQYKSTHQNLFSEICFLLTSLWKHVSINLLRHPSSNTHTHTHIMECAVINSCPCGFISVANTLSQVTGTNTHLVSMFSKSVWSCEIANLMAHVTLTVLGSGLLHNLKALSLLYFQ